MSQHDQHTNAEDSARCAALTGSAFIRQCDTCKMVTAIDLDPPPEHWREMCLYGQTILTVSHDEAMRQWKTSGRCKCTPNDKVRDGGPIAPDSTRGATPPFSAPLG